MNNQEAFDKMLNHLRKQKVQAIDSSGECMYRSEDGNKCAVGALIPDEEYQESFEGKSADGIRYECSVLRSIDPELLQEAQNIHDIDSNVDKNGHLLMDKIEKGFERLASTYDLQYTPPS